MLSSSDFHLLDTYLRAAFGSSYKRLIERVSRWSLRVEPLSAKGNTAQTVRWNVPKDRYPYLYATEEDCNTALHRLLTQIVFMQDAPSFPNVDQIRAQIITSYPHLQGDIVCPLTSTLSIRSTK